MNGQNKAAKWREIAHGAYEQSQGEGASTSSGRIAYEGNRLLYLFYRGLSQDAQMEEEAFADGNTSQKTWRMCLSRCVNSLRMCEYRVIDAQQLLAVNGFGQATVKPATQVLWQLYPPGELTDEDRAALAAVNKAKQDAKDAERKAQAEKRAAQRKAAKQAAGHSGSGRAATAPLLDMGTHFAGAFTMGDLNRMMGVPPEQETSSDEEGEEGQGRGRGTGKGKRAAKPKAPRKPKEYRPQGVEHETKHSTMQKAEASGLSNKSLYNASQNQDMLRPGDRFYDGWSSVTKSLINRTPPLVQAWSNPKKVRLTNEGIVLAASLFKDALARGKVQPLPGVNPDDDMILQAPASDQMATQQTAASPAVGLGTAAGSGSTGKGRGRGHGRGRAAGQGGGGLTPGAVGHGSQHGLQPARPSSGAAPRSAGRASGQHAGTGHLSVLGGVGRRDDSMSDDSGDFDDAEMHVDGGTQEHGAWGGAVCEGDLGFMYDSDEADPYGYGLLRDDGPAAKRLCNKENNPTAFNASQSGGRRVGEGGPSCRAATKAVPKLSPFAKAHAQDDSEDVIMSGQQAAPAVMAQFGPNNAGNNTCRGMMAGDYTIKQGSAAGSMQGRQPLHALLGVQEMLHVRPSSPEVIVLSDSDDDVPAAAAVQRGSQAGVTAVGFSGGPQLLMAVAPGVPGQAGSGRSHKLSGAVTTLKQEYGADGVEHGVVGPGSGTAHRSSGSMQAGCPRTASAGLGALLGGSQQSVRSNGADAVGKQARRSGSGPAAGLPPRTSGGVQGEPAAGLPSRMSGGVQGTDRQHPRVSAGVQGSERQHSAGLGGLLAGGPATSTSRGSLGVADRVDTLTSVGGSASDAAAAAISSGQPYRWQLPRMSDMPRDGTPAGLRLPPLRSGARFSDQYEVVLVLDQREQFTRRHAGHNLERTQAREVRAEQMRTQGIQVVERTLPIGDVTWVARCKHAPHLEYMLDQVLERKSCSDLVQSIHEKQRFQRQKWWLRQCGLSSVLYLIEGNPDAQKLTTADIKAVKTVMMSNELDGIRVLRTENVNESVTLLVRLTRSLQRLCDAQSATQDSSTADAGEGAMPLFSVWEERVKRLQASAQRTVRDVWGCMLSAVPGLGPNTVEAITDKYPTPLSLYQAYQAAIRSAHAAGRDPMAAARDLLAGLPLPSRVGSVANRSRDVFNSLFAQDVQLWLA